MFNLFNQEGILQMLERGLNLINAGQQFAHSRLRVSLVHLQGKAFTTLEKFNFMTEIQGLQNLLTKYIILFLYRTKGSQLSSNNYSGQV